MNVCAKCINEADLQIWIKKQQGPRGCDFCGRRDAPVADIDELADFMRGCLEQVWGYAVEQLPYESSEGGYQGRTWDTWDLLFDELMLDFPRDDKHKLRYELCSLISEETWCEYDWLSLDEDEVMRISWARFCEIVKHERRYFFSDIKQERNDRDNFAPSELLARLGEMAAQFGLVKSLSAGTKIFRARTATGRRLQGVADVGPPPVAHALQSNRMNPPGVPMFYAAEARKVAIAEIQSTHAYVGTFLLYRETFVLDFVDLPSVPGIFAGADRLSRLGLIFLHDFREDIMKPVARDERTHIDYIPTQIVTEFFRHHGAAGQRLDGIRYPSAVIPGGRNLVLFATQEDVEMSRQPQERGPILQTDFILKLVSVRHIRI